LQVAKILFVDFSGHVHHVTGHFLLRLRVTRKLEVSAVGGVLCVTETTFHTQRDLKVVHDFHEFFMGDVFRQNLRFFGFIGGPCCGPCCAVAGPCCPMAGPCCAVAARVTTANIKLGLCFFVKYEKTSKPQKIEQKEMTLAQSMHL